MIVSGRYHVRSELYGTKDPTDCLIWPSIGTESIQAKIAGQSVKRATMAEWDLHCASGRTIGLGVAGVAVLGRERKREHREEDGIRAYGVTKNLRVSRREFKNSCPAPAAARSQQRWQPPRHRTR